MFGGVGEYPDTQVIELSEYMHVYSSRYNVCIEYEIVSIFMNNSHNNWKMNILNCFVFWATKFK